LDRTNPVSPKREGESEAEAAVRNFRFTP